MTIGHFEGNMKQKEVVIICYILVYLFTVGTGSYGKLEIIYIVIIIIIIISSNSSSSTPPPSFHVYVVT